MSLERFMFTLLYTPILTLLACVIVMALMGEAVGINQFVSEAKLGIFILQLYTFLIYILLDYARTHGQYRRKLR